MIAGPVVIKLGGAALDDARALGPLWDAIAALAATTPGGVVLVHGGGAAVDAHLARLGLTSERRAGLRVTPDGQIGEVVAVLRGSVNTRLVGLLCARGVAAVGLGLSDGGACVCTKHEPDGVDLGRVGTVAAHTGVGNAAESRGGLWRGLLAAGHVPVLCSIGLDARGEPLNVNADDAASAVADILHASMLVLLTDVPGVLDADGSIIASTDLDGIESRIADGTIAGGMIPKARAAAASAEASGVPTVIASWKDLDGFASLGSGGHPGTRITPRRRTPAGTHA
ncbi:MAG: acetylglutamate kinase [Phycisphaerales bacterium JB041]